MKISVDAFSLLLPSGKLIQAAFATEDGLKGGIEDIFGHGKFSELISKGAKTVPVTITYDPKE